MKKKVQNIDTLLTLACFGKIGPKGLSKICKLLQLESNDQLELHQLKPKLMMAAGISESVAQEFSQFIDEFKVEKELARLNELDVNLICESDEEYPALLKEIHDPPYLLFAKGELDFLHDHTLAVVGSRKHTHYGREIIEKIIPDLVRHGMIIVSGLALGIDALAHRLTLDNDGKTAAVIGSGLDKIYPADNHRLADEIIDKGGAIITEYPLGSPPLKQHFPARNRIISGICRGVLVVECDVESGAMITAHHSIEQNRDVLAVPGLINSLLSSGPNALLKMGARPITESKDILENFGLVWEKDKARKSEEVKLGPNESEIFSHLSHDPVHIDTLQELSKLEMADVGAALLFLEMKGLVRNIGAANYIKR